MQLFGMLVGRAMQHHVQMPIQAFLQSELDDSDLTYVIIPVELWLDEWHTRFDPGTRLAVRLKKSLYGHPKAGRWWQDHLDRRA